MAFHSHLQLEDPGNSRAGGVGLAEQALGPVGPTHRTEDGPLQSLLADGIRQHPDWPTLEA